MSGHTSLLSSADVGSMNRARVMRHLYREGPTTRADLAARLGVSRATIGSLVQPLLKGGLLVEQEPRAAGGLGGKPAIPLWFGDKQALGAIYLSSDEFVVALIGMDGEVLASTSRSISDTSGVSDIETRLDEACNEIFADRNLAGIGVAFAGMVDTDSGVLIANYRRPSVGLLALRKQLGEAFGVPVFVDHHPRVQAFGDAWFGSAREIDDFVSVITGEVLGVGMMQRGQILRGVSGAGGEAGHAVIEFGGMLCSCGRRGCWETVATLGWLREQAVTIGLDDPMRISTRRLVSLTEAGSVVARELLGNYLDRVAAGLANIEHLLGLGVYLIHGDVAGGGEMVRAHLEREIIRESPARTPEPRVLLVPDPDRSTLHGAAGMVLANLYQATL